MTDTNFTSTMDSLLKGMDSFIATKTVVGDVMHVGDAIILPLVEATFGVGAGVTTGDKNKGGGGMGGKITPSAILVIKDGTTKLVNVKNQDSLTKLLDMVPELIDKFTKKDSNAEESAAAAAADASAGESDTAAK